MQFSLLDQKACKVYQRIRGKERRGLLDGEAFVAVCLDPLNFYECKDNGELLRVTRPGDMTCAGDHGDPPGKSRWTTPGSWRDQYGDKRLPNSRVRLGSAVSQFVLNPSTSAEVATSAMGGSIFAPCVLSKARFQAMTRGLCHSFGHLACLYLPS